MDFSGCSGYSGRLVSSTHSDPLTSYDRVELKTPAEIALNKLLTSIKCAKGGVQRGGLVRPKTPVLQKSFLSTYISRVRFQI